jgi:hypothetical protein
MLWDVFKTREPSVKEGSVLVVNPIELDEGKARVAF